MSPALQDAPPSAPSGASLADLVSQGRQQGLSNADMRQYLTQSPQYQQGISQGLSPDEIWNYLNLQDQEQTGLRVGPLDLGREADLFSNALVNGALDTLGLPGSVEQLARQLPPVNAAAGQVNSFLGQPAGEHLFLTPQDLKAPLEQAGLLNPSNLTPQSFGENKLNVIGEGAGGALLGNPRLIVAGIGGALGADTATEYLGSPLGPIVGGLVGGTAPDTAEGTIRYLLNAIRNPAAMGEDVKSALQGLKSNQKGAIADLQSAAQERAEKVASALGAPTDYESAGNALQAETRQWLNGYPDGAKPADAPADWRPAQWAPNSLPAQLESAFAPLKAAIGNSPETDMIQTMFAQDPTKLRAALASADPNGSQGLVKLFDAGMAKAAPLMDLAQTTAKRIVSSPLDPDAETIDPAKLARGVFTQPAPLSSQFIGRAAQIAPESMQNLAATFLNPAENEPGGLAKWIRLPKPVQEAIVPDAAHRAELNAAATQHIAAPIAVKQRIASLQNSAKIIDMLSGSNALNLWAGESLGRDTIGAALNSLGVPGGEGIGATLGLAAPITMGILRRGLHPEDVLSPGKIGGVLGGLAQGQQSGE